MSDHSHPSGPQAQHEVSKKAPNLKLLRRVDVERLTGLSRSTIYDWMKRGEFPQPVKLGERLVAWREDDVTAWIESRETRST